MLAQTPLIQLDVNPTLAAVFVRAGLRTPADVLHHSVPEMVALTQLERSKVEGMRRAVARAVLAKRPAMTALDMARPPARPHPAASGGELYCQRLSTDCAPVDALLGGGLPQRMLTEIVGESASGKTQWCLQLALAVQLPLARGGLNGGLAMGRGALFLATEDAFPNRRLHQLIGPFKARHPEMAGTDLTSNIFVEHAGTVEDLWEILSARVPRLLANSNVRLLVIDSLAALFRVEYGRDDGIPRAKTLMAFGRLLKKYADEHSLVVVCVNQVSDFVAADPLPGSSSSQKIPALGLAWSDIVNVRLFLQRECRRGDDVRRAVSVVLSPCSPAASARYAVTEAGVVPARD